jgi:hypothetical protein
MNAEHVGLRNDVVAYLVYFTGSLTSRLLSRNVKVTMYRTIIMLLI